MALEIVGSNPIVHPINFCNYAPVGQRIERLASDQEVAGSNPAGRATNGKHRS